MVRRTALGALMLLLAVPATARAEEKPYRDVRQRERAERTLTRVMKDGRAALERRLGPQGVLDVDKSTGTPRVLARLDGALSGPSADDPVAIADGYVRSHLAALGLTAADLETFGPATTATSPSGITQVRRRQSFDGIPSADGELRVNVARDGRVLNVLGSPAHAPSVGSTAPALDAGEAVRAIQADVGSYRSLPRAKGPTGRTRSTTFRDGSSASLELFQRAAGTRLAWRVLYKAAPDAVYDAVIDARSGEVLQRANIVKSDASGLVWERYPGPAGAFGTQRSVDMSAWLTSSATLTGPNAHAYSDLNDNDRADAGEEVAPGQYPFGGNATASLGCDAQHLCSWTATSGSWQANRQQNAVQAFYYVNKYHDHLYDPPIGFTPAWGSFDGDDPLELNTNDGASILDGAHVNNANMATPRDGSSPRMQMYLFRATPSSPVFRQVNGGDDAAIVYHEYTHGLSNRLVTSAGGSGALNSAQAGAMGEAWSDWYALDFLTRQGYIADTDADGEVDIGAYTDAVPHRLRSQPADCSVGITPVVSACRNGTPAGDGGYTYGDFGKVAGVPEVHADGEIWLETLWDIRKALGSELAEQLITDGMRLSPPEPSFLDERNAILQADVNAGGAEVATLWEIFRRRGMGYFAGTFDSSDATPSEDFTAPPAPGSPRGTITGKALSADTGLPLRDVTVGISGLMSGADKLVATTTADGSYTITGVPAADYPRLVFMRDGWDPVSRPVSVTGGATATANASLRRNWAAARGGAAVTSNHEEYAADYGCGAAAAVDQSLATGWSSENPANPASSNRASPVQMTVVLMQPIEVSAFALDPKYACGDGASDATASARVETSTSSACTGFVTALPATSFEPSQYGRLNAFAPVAGASGVRCVRLSLLGSAGGSGSDFLDLSEFSVYGGPPNVLPSGTITADPNPAGPGAFVTLTAHMTDPDSAITGYEWDFGDGSSIATTADAQTGHVYGSTGSYTARVSALDYRGGKGAATPVTIRIENGEPTPTPTATATATPTATATATATPRATPEPAPAPTATPAPSVTPKPLARPTFLLPASGKASSAALKVKCADACTISASADVDAKTAKRLGVKRLGARTAKLTRAGTATVTLKLSPKARSALRRRGLKSVTVTLKASARYATGAPATASKKIKIRV